VVLDATVGVEHQSLRRAPVGERREVLRCQGVQPAEPVVARYGEHVAVRAVDHDHRARRRPLLAERVTVVPCDRGVHCPWRSRNGAGQYQDR